MLFLKGEGHYTYIFFIHNTSQTSITKIQNKTEHKIILTQKFLN